VGVVAGAGPVEVLGDFDRDLGEAGGVKPLGALGQGEEA
jgi:hypothetical protein